MTRHAPRAPRRRWAAAALLLTLALASAGAGARAQTAATPSQNGADPALTEFLAAVREHPAAQAAEAAARAAELRYRSVFEPVAFDVQGGIVRVGFTEPDRPDLPDFIEDLLDDLFAVPESGAQLSLSATLRPVVIGDLRDLAEQRRSERDRALLAYREALTGLEAQALEAAGGVILARQGLELARRGRDLAAAALAATRTRAARGGAAEQELLRAELQLAEAEQAVLRAEANLALAEAALAGLTGDARLEALPHLPPVQGTAAGVLRAELDRGLAAVGLANARRALLPTVQAGYTWNLPEERSSVALSLESRTLQPTLTYTYADGAASAGGALSLPGAPQARTTFTIGASVRLSGEALAAAEAAELQLLAADAALRSAEAQANLEAQAQRDALAATARQVTLADRSARLAAQERDATADRVELGLASPLELDQAELALAQAELGALQARLDRLARTLDTYRHAATPPSEVLP